MYNWRRLTPEQQKEVFESRRTARRPWHSPPHRFTDEMRAFIISAACFEHAPIIGTTPDRMHAFSDRLLETSEKFAEQIFAWCVLPNHYHIVIQTKQIEALLAALGQMHGGTSYEWNGQENKRGRQVWFNAFERIMRSERHLWASVNYVHHNPVKHGYVQRWQDWAWSSANDFLDKIGREEAARIWRTYPINKYGEGWDD